MPILLEKLPNEPILIATYSGHVTIKEMRQMFAETLRHMDGHSGYIYRIADISGLDADFEEILAINQQAAQVTPGSTHDPNMVVVFVGKNEWVKLVQQDALFQEALQALNIPIFDDLKDALAAVRQMIKAV